VRHIGASRKLPDLPALIELGVFDTFQVPYSCLAPEHHDWITRAAEAGAGIIVRGGIAHGGPDAVIRRPALDSVWERAGLDELLDDDMSRAELILRQTLSHPHAHTIIVGTCDPEHLAENISALDRGPLSEDLQAEIIGRIRNLTDTSTSG
jgi:aryl-alcohol dehydrogenase-like predicted oxidoreductase